MTNAQVSELRKKYEDEITDLKKQIKDLQVSNANWQEQYKRISVEANKWTMLKDFLVKEVVTPTVNKILDGGGGDNYDKYLTQSDLENYLDENNYVFEHNPLDE